MHWAPPREIGMTGQAQETGQAGQITPKTPPREIKEASQQLSTLSEQVT